MTTPLQEPSYWILTALAGGRRHGYAILQEVDDLSGHRVRLKVTTLYAALDRLGREGLVADDGEETVDGRRRRYVVLTGSGAARLQEEARQRALQAARATERLLGWTPAAGGAR